jgi:hypothetical protein
VVFSPQANYTDWATVTCWRNLEPTSADRGVSRGQRGGSPTVVEGIINFIFSNSEKQNSDLSSMLLKWIRMKLLKCREKYDMRRNIQYWISRISNTHVHPPMGYSTGTCVASTKKEVILWRKLLAMGLTKKESFFLSLYFWVTQLFGMLMITLFRTQSTTT